MSRWNSGLNPEQAQAVAHDSGPLLILAGAGSGKTTVLVARTGRLIDERIAAPENLLVLTFTNKAARELKHRVVHRLGDLAKGLWAGTFHSFGLQLLRKYHQQADLPNYFGILDSNDSQGILRELLRDIRIPSKDKFDLSKVMELINLQRTGAQRPPVTDEYSDLAEILGPKYIRRVELLGAVDFEGLLLRPLELIRQHPEIREFVQAQFQQVMVDEFQDTNPTQMQLIHEIVCQHLNITVVGDDDQSIYGWRGAEVKNILDFPKRYKPCQVIRLERNYRSSPAILAVANGVIAKNKHRHGKILRSEQVENLGERPEIFVFATEEEEAEFVVRDLNQQLQTLRPQDLAVLYRSNSQGGLIESVLRQNQIPYTVSGSTAFFDRKEIKDILAYLRFALSPNDVSLRRIINTPSRGIGETSLEKINDYAKRHQVPFAQACRDCHILDIPARTIESLKEFQLNLAGLKSRLIATPEVGANLLVWLRELGFRDHLLNTSSSTESGDKRWTLVEIFSRVLDSFVAKGGATEKTLREFVDAMELREDGSDDEEKSTVSLMTLHASKGLEFPVVYLIGVEEDLLPHRTLGGNVDEERRLFYVGLTRAKQKLILSRCRSRKRYGAVKPVTPSRFLLEIPPDLVRVHESGMRPVSREQRENLVSDFLAKLAAKSPVKNSNR